MSTFPTKILLATDGSEDAQLAATTAVDVANSTDSELHVVHRLIWLAKIDQNGAYHAAGLAEDSQFRR